MNRVKIMIGAVLVLALAGCVQGDFGVKINKDGSGVHTITLGIEESVFEQFGGSEGETIDSTNDDLEAQGYTVENYNEDGYVGFRATKEFEEVSDMQLVPDTEGLSEAGIDAPADDSSVVNSPVDLKMEEGLFTDTYLFEGEMDLSNSAGLGGMEQMLASQMDMTFTLELPIRPSDHNADEADGRVLTWDVDLTGTNNIMVEAKAPNITNIIVASVVVLVVVAGLMFFVRRRKKQKEA
ncbi:hypothetical protein LF817_13135 [Halobacillus sp. A1]|uniref:LppM family (lipo)protein n=1 Tax=Halobacillus sp. A1 TaxID=2880262 RepID=UPI0020A64038|nr:hypothetical protein [Halobacillus sp. A1]MCP3032285.1 hypothetical protein [Halobacillus sp. A1]